jgi:hypothetical protein
MRDAANQEDFTASMADAASTIVDYFPKGQIGYISVLANISTSCDCAGASAPAPRIKDIGILASTDPVAIDKAGLDLIRSNVDEGTNAFLSQVTNLKGENTVTVAERIGIGSQDYNLITVEGNSNGNNTNNNDGDIDDNDDDDDDILNFSGCKIMKLSSALIALMILIL